LQGATVEQVELSQAGESLEPILVLQNGATAERDSIQAGESFEGIQVHGHAFLSFQVRRAQTGEQMTNAFEVAALKKDESPEFRH
jgi:hypothetical protein